MHNRRQSSTIHTLWLTKIDGHHRNLCLRHQQIKNDTQFARLFFTRLAHIIFLFSKILRLGLLILSHLKWTLFNLLTWLVASKLLRTIHVGGSTHIFSKYSKQNTDCNAYCKHKHYCKILSKKVQLV